MTWKRFTMTLIASTLWTGIAVAQDAVLYEVNENMKIAGGRVVHRLATAALLGVAKFPSPLCREEAFETPLPQMLPLLANGEAVCVVNAIGSDNISGSTGTGPVEGRFTVVVQEPGTIDSPEFVVMRGTFRGQGDLSTAASTGLGTIQGTMTAQHSGRNFPFTGIFRLPFPCPPLRQLRGADACYATGTGVVPVADSERAIGFPTVRLEITFD